MTNEDSKIQSPNPKAHIWWWVATWFGSGLSPKASGTAGSFAALPFAFLIQYYSGNLALLIASIMLFIIGWWASNEYMKYYPEKHDPKAIVVDEVVGMWLTLCGISSGSIYPVDIFTPTWEYYVAGFALFRFFDILKPWPISWADRTIKEGFGVMFDDVMAAIFSVIVLKIYLLLSLIYAFSQ